MKPFETLNGEHLLPDLINFTTNAAELERNYLKEFLKHPERKASFARAEGKMISTTVEEREKYEAVENLTKAQLKEKAFDIIRRMPEDMSKLLEDHFKRAVNGKNKEEYVSFFNEISEIEY